MVNLEILKKFTWSRPIQSTDLGGLYNGHTYCSGTAKTRWKDGSEQFIGVSIIFKPGHNIYDLKEYVNKFTSAILAIQSELADKEAELI